MKRVNVRSVLSVFESAVYILAQSIAPTIGIMLFVHLINRWPQLRSPRKREIGPGPLLIGIFIIRPDANSQESYAESRDDIKRTVMNGDEAPQE